MLRPKGRFEYQLGGRIGKSGDRNGVAEHIVHPAQLRRLRRDDDSGIQEAQIMAVARPTHESMLAERHGHSIPIRGSVFDFEDGQRDSNSGIRGLVTII
jgi:hypothetical protein